MHPTQPAQPNNENQTPGAGVPGTNAFSIGLPPGGHNKFFSQNHSTPSVNISPEKFKEANLSPENSQEKISQAQPVSKITPEKIPQPLVPINESFILNRIKFDPSIGPKMYEWFCSKQKRRTVTDTFVWKDGEVQEKYKEAVNPPPHFSEFARSIGTTANTLKNWAKNNKEFAQYYDACQDIIQEFMIDNGVTGEYASQMTIFAAKNTTKMKDQQDHLHKTINFKDVLDAIESGKDINEEAF